MSPIRSTALAATALTAALVGTAVPAAADPVNAKKNVPVSVSFDNGQTYETVANGNARFSPAHDVNSTPTLVPVSFGPETFTVTNAAGDVIDQGTDAEGETKGSSASTPVRPCPATCSSSRIQTGPPSRSKAPSSSSRPRWPDRYRRPRRRLAQVAG